MNTPLLKIENLSLTYHSSRGETEALKNVNFDVNVGEFIAIVGPSGCGKTTLLNIIGGLLQKSRGNIYLDGKKIYEENSKKHQFNNNIGYMFQRDHLFEWRTILDNVKLGLEFDKKLTKSEKIKKEEYILFLLEKYGLIDFKNKYPRELSGGMRQRVALIRTLALNPKILLLDEPFSALDFQTRLKVCDDVSNIITKENKTALLVTHDISEAISLSDKILVLSKRPATVKKIVDIDLKSSGLPLKRRENKNFSKYFEEIWRNIKDEEKE
ncbi:MAG: ABC transporter ATP-binding protein [Clostridiales bacterium]|nr:ABC transporter ATP-binding protein [Clostridiales bacterium]